MITFSSTIGSILNSKNIKYFYLVNIQDLGNYTSLPFDIQMDDTITYNSDGGLYSVEPPSLSSIVDRATYKLLLLDPTFSLRNYLEQGAVGKQVVIRLGFFNTTSALVDGTNVGEPFKALSNTITVYKGIIDTYSYSIDLREGSSIVELEISSPMADLDLVKGYHTNKDFLSQLNANDTAYNEVYDGASSVKLKWGKV
jgi:hypothetical protein